MDAGFFGDFYFGRSVWHRRRGMPGLGGWFGQKALAGGGPLIGLGMHRLDMAPWLMGCPPARLGDGQPLRRHRPRNRRKVGSARLGEPVKIGRPGS